VRVQSELRKSLSKHVRYFILKLVAGGLELGNTASLLLASTISAAMPRTSREMHPTKELQTIMILMDHVVCVLLWKAKAVI
jgi:hypothetical protein